MPVDDIDKGILFLLQQDARHITTQEMADRVGVSASTVRNRIENLEAESIIRGYYPDIDYEKAGLQLHMLFICSTPAPDRERLAHEAHEIDGVVSAREVLNGTDNVQVEAVGTDTDDIARISDTLSEIGLEIGNSKILKRTLLQPFDHFGESVVKDETDG